MIGRRDALSKILQRVKDNDLLLTTTGMISREVFALQDRPGNLYMIGSMGLLSALGLGLSLVVPGRRVLILEGDGSALMSLGTWSLVSAESPGNFIHIVLDNEAYESTGAQPSISSKLDLAGMGQSCGYKSAVEVSDLAGLDRALATSASGPGPHMIVVKTSLAASNDIPRVSREPTEIRDRFRDCVLRSR